MRFHFSLDELSALRRAVKFAIQEHASLYGARPCAAHGLKMFQNLDKKLDGIKSQPQPSSAP